MRVFAENAWEADATGDKLSKELFENKRKKKDKAKHKLKKETKSNDKGKSKHESSHTPLSAEIATAVPSEKMNRKRKFLHKNAEHEKSAKKFEANVAGESISLENKQDLKPKRKKVKKHKDKKQNNVQLDSNSGLVYARPVKDNDRFLGSKKNTFKSKIESNGEVKRKFEEQTNNTAKQKTAESTKVLTKTQKRKLQRKKKLTKSKTVLENDEPSTQQYVTGKKKRKEGNRKKQKLFNAEVPLETGSPHAQLETAGIKKQKEKNKRKQKSSNSEMPSENEEPYAQQSVNQNKKKENEIKRNRKEQLSKSEMPSESGEPHSQQSVSRKKKKRNATEVLLGKIPNSKHDNKIANKVKKLEKLNEKKMRKKNSQVSSGEEMDLKESNATLESQSKRELNVEKLKRMLTSKQSVTDNRNKKFKQPESLRDKMLARLKSSRFRYLNEQLYNSESFESKKYFKEDPDAFVAYHEGYRQQVEQWPLNPIDTIIAAIQKMPKEYVIADFGCGEAKLAESVPQKVHSLDLVAVNDSVTACDMAHTPLLTSGINVVVFCLSLMGTNLNDYLIEANRVLKKDGILKIAEVESRFDNVEDFINILASYGFVNTWSDLSCNLFYFMDFRKESDVKKRNKLPSISLKPCLYKKR